MAWGPPVEDAPAVADNGWGPPVQTADATPQDGWGPPVQTADATPQDGWGPPHTQAPEHTQQEPMPGIIQALRQGLGAGVEQSQQSLEALQGQKIQEDQKPSAAAAPLQWSDVTSPLSKLAPKVAYQFGESSPTLAGGLAGGLLGSAIGPEGTLGGGALGAAAGSAFQAIGPSFKDELNKSPNDPNGAWSRAIERASASGAFSGAGWALFGANFFEGPVKNLAFQVFGVQPGVNVAEQATQNVIQGKPATENLGQAYAQGAVGTAVPLAGHAALRGLMDRSTPVTEPVKPDIAPIQDAIDQASPPSAQPEPSKWDSVPFAKQFKSMTDSWKGSFQPEMMSELSRESEGFFRSYNSATSQAKDAIINTMDGMHNAFEKLPEDQQMAFMKGAAKEEGYEVSPELKPYADEFRRLLDLQHQADKDVGSKLGYVADYFPREFENPDQASSFINNRIQSLGPKWFQKARTNDLLQEGLDAGLKLRTTNPADLVTNRLLSSVDLREKTNLLKRLGEIGAAAKADDPGAIADFAKQGWQAVKDPVGNNWALHPDVQPLWKNAVTDKGLWGNEGVAGNIFRGWMGIKNAYVPIKLALSAFHPLHVSHINLVDGMTRGWTQLTRGGDLPGAIKSVAKGVYGQFYHPEAIRARNAWLTPEWDQTPEQKGVVKNMIEGGFSPQLSEQLRMKGTRSFNDALSHSQWAKAVPLGILQGLRQVVAKPIFEKWIPSLKTAAYLDESRALFERRPDLLDNPVLRKAAQGAIAKSIDNRYGEMFYKNLFWNKTLKDMGIGSFLSLGWNLGFVREFGGGALEPFMRPLVEQTPTREAVNAAKNKTAFALFYMANAMILNAVMTKMMSGENPDGMDYFLPRIGGNNPDGSPRRISNMFYTREIPMLEKHMEEQQSPLGGLREMLWNKMMFEPIHELMNNRDYYGYNIMDPSQPWYQQYYQLGKYILSDQFNPITIMGAKRALQASGKWNDNDSLFDKFKNIVSQPEGELALAGFGPAPAYAAKTPTLNRLTYLFSHYVSPEERPQAERDVMEKRRDARNALWLAQRNHDSEGIQKASKALSDLGLTSAAIKKVQPGTSDIYMYSRLPQNIQASFLKELPPEDFKRYYAKSNKRTKADPEVQGLYRQYYQ